VRVLCGRRQRLVYLRTDGRSSQHRGRWWSDPTRKTFLEHMKAERYALFDRDEHRQHDLNLSFVVIDALEDEYEQHEPS